MQIHATAVVSPKAELAEGVKIGPYSSVGDGVVLGRDTEVGANAVIEGPTRIGERNRIFPFVCIGCAPQDIGYRGEDTRLVIGDDNVIREYVTIHRATTKETWETAVGSHNYFMAYSHIAHDCRVGDHVVLANVATLAGHVRVGDHASLGGLVAVHQFVRIGAYAFVGGGSGLDKDVPPFMLASGPRAKLYGINRKGLSRMGLSEPVLDGLKTAYRIIWRENRRLSEAVDQVRREVQPSAQLDLLLGFFEGSKRGIMR